MPQRTRTPLDRTKASTNATTVKPRRSHRKSRNGCTECKKRHIRCDEQRPSCANCETAERVCSFQVQQVGKKKQDKVLIHRAKRQRQPEATATTSTSVEVCSTSNVQLVHNLDEEYVEQSSPLLKDQNNHLDLDQTSEQLPHRSLPITYALPPLTSHNDRPCQIPSPAPFVRPDDIGTPPADCCPGLLNIPEAVPKALFTPHHMVLLHHADKVPNFTSSSWNIVDIAVRHIVGSPYLMDEVLAITAFHMASSYSGSAVYLRQLATELQNRALTTFTRLTGTIPHDDKSTAIPRFLFSAILGWHVLAETLTYCHSDFHSFIDRFVECINLNRGIKAVAPPAWDYLYNSELRPFLAVVREAEQKIISPGSECDSLRRLMDDSDLNDSSIKSCRQTIAVLQWAFDICHVLDEDNYPQSVTAFSVGLEGGFVDVLRKRQPEALVILSHYGVLLHRCRSFWPFGDAGACIIRAIAGQLGSYWQDALAWPLHVLETESNSGPLSLAS